MIDCTEQFGINFANDNSLFPMSDGEILEQQKNDMQELEKQARMKEEQIKKEKLRIQNEKIEEEKKLNLGLNDKNCLEQKVQQLTEEKNNQKIEIDQLFEDNKRLSQITDLFLFFDYFFLLRILLNIKVMIINLSKIIKKKQKINMKLIKKIKLQKLK